MWRLGGLSQTLSRPQPDHVPADQNPERGDNSTTLTSYSARTSGLHNPPSQSLSHHPTLVNSIFHLGIAEILVDVFKTSDPSIYRLIPHLRPSLVLLCKFLVIMATESPHRAEDYTVGWICALPVELAASAELLDVEHPQLPHDTKDSNSYTFGSIAGHNIVIGCLPFGQIGLVSAASVAIQMKSRFPSIRFGLMVGIGGGVPTENSDIRLGDVVVSLPSGQYGGVVQYDMGKTLSEGQNIRTGALNAPPQILLTALAAVEAARLRDRFDLKDSLSSLGARLPKFAYPQKLRDRLYKSTYAHSKGATCAQCSEDQLEERPERDDVDIVIHYGTIASGNQVMKDGVERDRLSSELGGVLCFEMEAAGLINNFPCVVIRGICDYADSHKNKLWQPYAAATAAAFAKALLGLIPATEVVKQPTVEETMKDLSQLTSMVADNTELSHKIEEKISSMYQCVSAWASI